jgi:hypothetical protein
VCLAGRVGKVQDIGDGDIPRVRFPRAGDGPLVVKDWLELFADIAAAVR